MMVIHHDMRQMKMRQVGLISCGVLVFQSGIQITSHYGMHLIQFEG